ncbi:hypothetical protein BIY21_17865 [Vibrio ponticus]|uniref:DUF2780 domain-containing protein n=1 Tax=Vibrio ponticus TaxID=265668 RepID=A0ABX3FB11_9VIBR|nr:DUF2780 domain-containing protein [Vibrio ponticus]OLQ86707.1 hypothetical protein BIY21_17865 [Vibrio ponticus]
MKKASTATLILLLFTTGAYAGSWLDSISDKDTQESISKLVTEHSEIADHSIPLSGILADKLPVTTEQALGGSGALLGLAQQQLSSADLSELESLIPWSSNLPDMQGIVGNIENMQAVNKAFESVGLDPSMVNQFVPVILDYLKESGASEGLLGSLSSLWKA